MNRTVFLDRIVVVVVFFQLKEIKLSSPPSLNSHQGTVHFSVTSVSERREFRVIHTSEVPDCKKSFDSITIPVEPNVQLTGDIKIEFYSESHLRAKKKKVLFRFWLNTYFVDLESAGKNFLFVCLFVVVYTVYIRS